MEGSSSQSGNYSTNTASDSLENDDPVSYKTIFHENILLLKLEEDGFTTPDDKVEELLKNLTKPSYLYALKLLFENLQNEFSSQVLENSLEALVDTSFKHYSKESVARLELHLRILVTVLERICFSPIVLSKELRDKVYNSLAKFAEIHRKTTQVIEIGLDNNFRSNFNQFNQQNNDQIAIKKRNYNIDFLLIHLRDTLHSLRDDETWFQEIIRRIRELLKTALNITPGILTIAGVNLPNDCSILSILTQIRQSFSFKYPVASYYIDWRIMLIIQQNLFIWSGSSEKIISKKFGELVLMEYIWNFLEREWVDVADKSILDSQSKFDEVSNKVAKALKNAGGFLNELAGNEPIALPHTLWQSKYDEAIGNIKKSLELKSKINNLYILLGNSHLLRKYSNGYIDYTEAIENCNIALKNDPNNYLCLKNCAYSYEKEGDYSNTLNLLDKLLNINKDSLVLCYYGEILYNMTQYRKAISYFTKAYTIDPENVHNLNRRAITYCVIKEYDKVLSDLDKIIQLDPLNSSAYYLKSLMYYTKNDNNNAKVSFKKYAELLNSDNILAKIQLFHLEYLLNKNSSKDLNNIYTKIDQIYNYSLYENEFLRFIKCKICIELKEYSKAKSLLNYIIGFTFIGYFMKDHPDFWSYLYEVYGINKCDFTEFGIVYDFMEVIVKKK
ncbi:hypothetical protein GLOIN_2v1846730 [Rhizophagus irregularis DAOM 181602=DAOM 197198]|nr:hypothetical protein GLOIN_2v1846730 [Rhizophagus irregularis DAOM 181602=DAOM 197198]